MTPNPNAKKFVLDAPIAEGDRGSFFNAAQAAGNKLASELFAVHGVAGVMWLNDFVTITKTSEAGWASVTAGVKRVIKSFSSDQPLR
jgi:hypothetical protein